MNEIDAGALNRRVQWQKRGADKDSVGQRDMEWFDYLETWAKIEQLEGRELLLAQAINAEITHRVTIRYREGFSAGMRGIYQGRALNIITPLDVDTEHVLLTIMCSEGLNRG